jgi:hypothetical protein
VLHVCSIFNWKKWWAHMHVSRQIVHIGLYPRTTPWSRKLLAERGGPHVPSTSDNSHTFRAINRTSLITIDHVIWWVGLEFGYKYSSCTFYWSHSSHLCIFISLLCVLFYFIFIHFLVQLLKNSKDIVLNNL